MYKPVASLLQHTARMTVSDVSVAYTLVTRGGGHMLRKKSQRTQNRTMFVNLDWPLNASRRLSASTEILVLLHVVTGARFQRYSS